MDDESEFLDYGHEDDAVESSTASAVGVKATPAKGTASAPVVNPEKAIPAVSKSAAVVARSSPTEGAAGKSSVSRPSLSTPTVTGKSSGSTAKASSAPHLKRALSVEKLSGLSQALLKASNLSDKGGNESSPSVVAPRATIVVGASASAGKTPRTGALASRTIVLRFVPESVLIESKISAHLGRYGKVEKVLILSCNAGRGECVVRFKDSVSANRAWVNRAPILKDQTIRLARIPDHPEEDTARMKAIEQAVDSKNRVYTAVPADLGETKQNPSVHNPKIPCVATAEAVSATAGTSDSSSSKPTSDAVEAKDRTESKTAIENAPSSSDGPSAEASGSGLYGDIDLGSRKRKLSISGGKDNEKDKSKPRVEKRTWTRAGLANLNDKDVLKAKANLKKAQGRVQNARVEVNDLMAELKKQKEQFTLIGSGASIGKNLRAELNSNINLLMAQLRSATGTMASAKAGVKSAEKLVEEAIEKSRAPDPDAPIATSAAVNAN